MITKPLGTRTWTFGASKPIRFEGIPIGCLFEFNNDLQCTWRDAELCIKIGGERFITLRDGNIFHAAANTVFCRATVKPAIGQIEWHIVE